MFVSRNFQLVYSQSHPWVGLETVGDLSLCFCNVSFLIRSCPLSLGPYTTLEGIVPFGR